jgi:hypothetical protein
VGEDRNGDHEADQTPEENEADLRRFSKHFIVFQPGTNWVELKLLNKRTDEPRPDLAVTVSKMAGQDFTVTVHNPGPAAAKNVEVTLNYL